MIFNKFISKERMSNLELEKMISAHKSETTHSAYFDFKTTNGEYYSLAVSDHTADNHLFDVADVLDNETDEVDDFNEFLNQWIYDDDFLVDCDCYGISKINQYSLDPKKLIGGYSEARAFISDEFKVTDAELIHDDHFLKVTYTNLEGNRTEAEVYNDYVPKMANEDDIATINYLLSSYDIDDVHEARRVYYQDGNSFSLTPKKTFDEDIGELGDDDEIYEFNGNDYVAESELLDQAINGDD